MSGAEILGAETKELNARKEAVNLGCRRATALDAVGIDYQCHHAELGCRTISRFRKRLWRIRALASRKEAQISGRPSDPSVSSAVDEGVAVGGGGRDEAGQEDERPQDSRCGRNRSMA